jgi:DNA-binding beta-propeller fold protein YncE
MRLTRRQILAVCALSLLSACGGRPGGSARAAYKVWGQAGRRSGSFVRPRAVSVKDNEVYVVDTTGRIQVFTFDGEFVRSWSTPAYENGTPTGVSFSREGRVLIPDTHYNQILEYSTDGKLLTQWGSYGTGVDEFVFPTDIAQAPDGTYYISEYGMEAERVHVFDAERRYARHWGGHGEAEGQLNRSMAIALDDQGTLYVVDTANNRVQCFDKEGALLRIIGEAGTEPGQLKYPHDIAIAPDGSLFVCEYGNNRISRFAQDGTFIACYGRPGRKPGEFNAPQGIAVSENGLVFVADTDNDRVQRMEVEGLR